ncbi:Surfeit locus 6 [Penicillium hetheringtonii]|uniref:Surfeit locus 6 n=1 Tax=Penicillium hetheringtonii TaxID=911720 RepID=A0AAD6DE73_9EURO|nr:Surfeit locus 6 [Penicillium hetheringtonii]
MDDIEDRLRSHAQAFDGLLSLIPAKYYYGDDNTDDQWQRKKQTKEQAREAKRAKLDPEAADAKTAKEVMEENARKRKREDGTLESDGSDGELGSENPKEGLKRGDTNGKKQKQTEKAASAAKSEEAEARKKQKEEKKEKKKAAQKEKKKAKETARKEKQNQEEKSTETPAKSSEKKPSSKVNDVSEKSEKATNGDDEDLDEGVDEGFSLEFHEEPENASSASSTRNSPGFDASNPQSDAKSSEPKALKPTPEDLKQRLQKRLDELRAKRHADGLNGKPARNRQELIEARRQKAEQRKAHKKELRQKAREEDQLKKDEAMARRFSPGGSGSLLASPRSPAESVGSNNNFSFGRVIFSDGQHTDASLTSAREQHKSRGPTDAAAQLKVAEAKKARLEGMSAEQRAELEEKDRWLNAKKRAHGERVRDDTSLLKKALKRKETAKKKSEREWKDRLDTVSRMKDQRQSKREENLRKRREEKGNKGKSKKSAGGGKKKARPGFEGSFKTKVGGKKK